MYNLGYNFFHHIHIIDSKCGSNEHVFINVNNYVEYEQFKALKKLRDDKKTSPL